MFTSICDQRMLSICSMCMVTISELGLKVVRESHVAVRVHVAY